MLNPAPAASAPPCRPRLGFLGLGWIGRHRMLALAESGAAEIAAIADTDPAALEAAQAAAPAAATCHSLDALLARELDGVVIATPSALHAAQAIAALGAGFAVFCQKPLARTGDEAARVVAAARSADRLLGVDLSYRHAVAFRALAAEIAQGRLGGPPHLLDLTFHNAYGPDKPWFRARALAGGGCLIDLGSHLLDAALWLTGATGGRCLSAALFGQGRRLVAGAPAVEDLALATLELDLPAGQQAVIEAAAYGPLGGASLRNVEGSFYDFEAHRHIGTRRERLAAPPDAWGGRAALAWASRLAASRRFDPSADELVVLSRLVDATYAAA